MTLSAAAGANGRRLRRAWRGGLFSGGEDGFIPGQDLGHALLGRDRLDWPRKTVNGLLKREEAMLEGKQAVI
jgi:hypothetical protein